MPGTTLSQFGISTKPSKPVAVATASMESAISSRLARENFMPVCPMAIPSQTPIAGNSIGVPPAAATPSLAASVISLRWIWPGITSLKELQIPINGFFKSSGPKPMALNKERWAHLVAPFLTISDLILQLSYISVSFYSTTA